MIFEILVESANNGELILVNGGFCHWHLRRDGQLTIREIIVLPEMRYKGIGRSIIEQLKQTVGATSIFARCPIDLPANKWYSVMGFILEGTEITKTGRVLNLWRLKLN